MVIPDRVGEFIFGAFAESCGRKLVTRLLTFHPAQAETELERGTAELIDCPAGHRWYPQGVTNGIYSGVVL